VLGSGCKLQVAGCLESVSGKAPAGSTRLATWYGYAAFVFALPYPLLRIIWALGGTPGLSHAGAGGEGFKPLILAIPWVMAAILSLMLVSSRNRMLRRLLLFAGWTATAIVASIGPAALWSLVTKFISGELSAGGDIANWVFCLFYGSWFLWAIAAFAATRSFQLRSADPGTS
jgi:DHA1 family inner membrane transport protein